MMNLFQISLYLNSISLKVTLRKLRVQTNVNFIVELLLMIYLKSEMEYSTTREFIQDH